MKDGEIATKGDELPFTVTWLGAASLVFQAGSEILAVDPFLTRPTIRQLLSDSLTPNAELVRTAIPKCDHILISHAHHDHLMDVPAVMAHTGAVVYAPPNACKLLEVMGADTSKVHCILSGEKFQLGSFNVEVVSGHHIWLPLPIFGKLPASLHHPPRFKEYRMDVALAYVISIQGLKFAVAPANPVKADILFAYPYQLRLMKDNLQQASLTTVIPIHWDNFFRPISAMTMRMGQLERLNMRRFSRMASRYAPHIRVKVIQPFETTSIWDLI